MESIFSLTELGRGGIMQAHLFSDERSDFKIQYVELVDWAEQDEKKKMYITVQNIA